ncbi:MAG: alpha/beta fold hydrolase [Candidatus Hodarchaeales archaeon]
MPFKQINDINIYYEIHGPEEAPFLTLFEGWGTSLWMWFRQLPELTKHYRTIIFDNRGVGRTTKPDIPYSIKMMADDARGLLKELKVTKTHILGVSMGGYIAQQFAASYSEMVKGLVIASTGFGGPKSRAVQPSDETLAKMFAMPNESLTLEQAIAIRRSTAWSAEFLRNNQKLIEKMDEWINDNPQPNYARNRQAEAALEFNSEPFLDKIHVPCLILHGEKDFVVPTENARMLHAKLNNSKLLLFKDSPHRIEVERYKDFNRSIIEFLKEVDQGSFKPEPNEIII